MQTLIVNLAAERHSRFGLGLLGDYVEGSARISPAIEGRGGAPQDLEALDGVGVRSIGVTPVYGKAVTVELAGGKTAHGEGR
ncbi:hypothetical protein D9M68_689650 [compost metagenome]